MEDSYLVLDIETVPDDPPGSRGDPDDRSDALGPLVRQRIVSIGVLWLDGSLRHRKLGTVAEGKDEPEVLADLHGFMDRHRPRLVTFNGRRFDVPVIMLRSFVHGVPMRWFFSSQEYRRRYDPHRHLDLCDLLSEHGAGRFPSLLDVASSMGLPGKLGMDGSEVLPAFERGEIEAIHTYCLMDVIQTGLVLMRWMLISGRLERADYLEAASSVVSAVEEDGRFDELLSSARLSDVLLERG